VLSAKGCYLTRTMTPLISPDDHATLWAIIASGAAAAIWLEQTYRWAARLSGPVIALLFAMILSNARVMPTEAPVYDFVEGRLVPLAIPLLLMRANLREIARAGRGLLTAFCLATLGTLLGTVLASWLLRGSIGTPATEHAAGLMAASYIGGGVNFFQVQASRGISANVANPLLVADNFVMAGFFILILGIAGSRWFRARYPHPHTLEASTGAAENLAARHWQRKGIGLLDLAKVLTFAAVAVALAAAAEKATKAAFGDTSHLGAGMQVIAMLCSNKFVLLTCITLVLATALSRWLAAINGADELGAYLLMLFLFKIGLPADLVAVLKQAPMMFVFCAIIAVMNVAIPLLVGRWLRLNLEELVLAMNATLGGPSTAAAMAVSAGWSRLVLPGLLIGLLGYIVGTPLGLLVIELLKR
jgi:uncharacterized membrane protein